MEKNKYVFMLICSMFTFGTIGLFRRSINLPSSLIACVRGLLGSLFLIVIQLLRKKPIDWENVKRHLGILLVSAMAMGFSWILLFESYRYTSIAISTLAYYMQPIFLMIASQLFFGEKLTKRKIAAILFAIVGMALVSNVDFKNGYDAGNVKGIVLALGAASLYAFVVIVNKKIQNINRYDRTVTQLLTAGLVLIPYVLITENQSYFSPTLQDILLLVLISIFHTGVTYLAYFTSIDHLKIQTVAMLGYIDPITAMIISATFLHEPITSWQILGAVLILAATYQ